MSYAYIYVFKQEFSSSFWIACLFAPGSIHCIFEKSNHHYTWKKVTTTVHNIIVGKLWIDQVRTQSAYLDVYFHIISTIVSVTK